MCLEISYIFCLVCKVKVNVFIHILPRRLQGKLKGKIGIFLPISEYNTCTLGEWYKWVRFFYT